MVHARNLRAGIRGARLVAVADVDPACAARAAQELELERVHTDYAEAVADETVDAVCIASPVFTHAQVALAAAKAGKHVFCEKPMALTLDEADSMIEACRQAGVKLQIGFMRRFDAGFREAKRLIDEGEIGDVILVRSVGRGPGLPGEWYLSFERSNGLLAEVNSHDFDTVRWLGRGELSRVYAEAGAFARPDLSEKHPGFFDSAVVNIRLENGVMGVIEGTCPDNYGYDARAEILGTRGVLFVGQIEEGSAAVCRKDGCTRPVIPSWQRRFRQAYVDEMTHFVECIVSGAEPVVTGLDGRKALEGVLAANRSLAEGVPVTLGTGLGLSSRVGSSAMEDSPDR
jgi:myo-inositol 2-dehydrogenase/D-chiro-inositol 1-dehydrogenase/scyllo-inositol 2-dehydrogenase (NAD+)